MIKVLAGVVLGYVLFTQPQARQGTADLLRAAADALSPAEGTKTPQEHLNDLITAAMTTAVTATNPQIPVGGSEDEE